VAALRRPGSGAPPETAGAGSVRRRAAARTPRAAGGRLIGARPAGGDANVGQVGVPVTALEHLNPIGVVHDRLEEADTKGDALPVRVVHQTFVPGPCGDGIHRRPVLRARSRVQALLPGDPLLLPHRELAHRSREVRQFGEDLRRLPEHWRTLCDDEALVVADRQEKYRAHPFPTWSEYLWKRSQKTWNVQYSVPLSAIFFLEQSGTDTIEPLGEGHAAVLITESASQIYEKFWRKSDQKDQREFREELFNNACTMAKKIPCYRLYVSLNGRFWEKMEDVLE